MDSTNQEYLQGTLRTIVLGLLAQQGRMYGYEITQAVESRTGGELTLTFGALYPVLHKLEEEGLLITQSQAVDGRLRKYYWLTSAGSETAVQKVIQFDRFSHVMRLLASLTSGVVLGN